MIAIGLTNITKQFQPRIGKPRLIFCGLSTPNMTSMEFRA